MSVAVAALVALLATAGATAPPKSDRWGETPPTPLERCTQQAKVDADGGARCLQALADAGGADAAAAAEALRVLQRLRRHRPTPPPASPRFTLSSAWTQRGVVEAGLHGVALGGVGGFVGASAIVAGLRTSEADSLPWLVAAPAFGALVVGATAVAGVTLTNTAPDDIALVASTTWAGLALSTGLQLSMLYGSVDVAAPALGFSTMLMGGALGLGAGVVLAPYLDATAGDVALANSGLVWGGVLGGLGAVTAAAIGNAWLEFGQTALWTTTGAGAAWLATLALHPWLHLHRLSTWLVDAGGVAGLLLAGSGVIAFNGAFSGSPTLIPLGLAAGAVGGLVVGGLAAAFVDARFDDSLDDEGVPPPLLSRVAPAVLPTPEGHAAAGVIVEVARW